MKPTNNAKGSAVPGVVPRQTISEEDRPVDGKIVPCPEAYRILTHARKHVLEHQLVQHYHASMEEDIRKAR
jgi:hypothetical protein